MVFCLLIILFITTNSSQPRVQIAGGLAGLIYAFFMTLAILILMYWISFRFNMFKLRASGEGDSGYSEGVNYINLDDEELRDSVAVSISCSFLAYYFQ
jgi:hypothetical protein